MCGVRSEPCPAKLSAIHRCAGTRENATSSLRSQPSCPRRRGWAAGLCGQLAGTALVAAAGGRPTRARPARPRWPRVREADRARCSFSSRPGCPRHGCTRAQPPSALAPRVPPGRDAGCEAKAGRAPGGHRVFDLRVQQRSTKCCSALPLAALSCCCAQPFRATALSPSLPAPSASPSLLPRPSALPSLSLLLGVLSPSLLLPVGPRSSLCAVPTSLCAPVWTTSPCTQG